MLSCRARVKRKPKKEKRPPDSPDEEVGAPWQLDKHPLQGMTICYGNICASG